MSADAKEKNSKPVHSDDSAMRTNPPEVGDSLSDNPPFTVFSDWQKRWISSTASFGALFSTLSSYIYLPALVPMARDLNVSVALINLTITSYLIVAGIAPAFMGDMADQSGRRPVYILMFLLMLGANVGMALQTSYPALLVLRMLQSAGASGTYGAAYGVIADITQVSERGSYVGTLILFTSTAPSFGPVLGGVLTEKLGWRWIFWFLVILTGVHFAVLLLFFPETQRKIVGNGSGKTRGIYRSAFALFLRNQEKIGELESVDANKLRHRFPNPLACIPVLFHKNSLFVIIVGSLTYTVKMTLQTSLAAQCIEIYRLNYLQAGLIYLPSGIGGAIGSHVTGRVLNWAYRRTTQKMGVEDLQRGDDLSAFPIEATRFYKGYLLVVVTALGTIGYGVALTTRAHISVMLVMQFLTGATTSSIFTMCGTLLTDLNPSRSATAQAAYNLVRCLGAGAGIAVLDPLVSAAGSGWTFSIYAISILTELPFIWLLVTRGLRWRVAEKGRDRQETSGQG